MSIDCSTAHRNAAGKCGYVFSVYVVAQPDLFTCFFSHFFLNSFRKIGLYFLDLVDKFLFYAMFRMFLLQKLYTIYRFEVETGIFGALSS